MGAHEEGVGAGLHCVAMSCIETHEAAEGRPAVVETVFDTEQYVGRVLHAWCEHGFLNISDCIRVSMSSSHFKPSLIRLKSVFPIGFKSVVQTA